MEPLCFQLSGPALPRAEGWGRRGHGRCSSRLTEGAAWLAHGPLLGLTDHSRANRNT